MLIIVELSLTKKSTAVPFLASSERLEQLKVLSCDDAIRRASHEENDGNAADERRKSKFGPEGDTRLQLISHGIQSAREAATGTYSKSNPQ